MDEPLLLFQIRGGATFQGCQKTKQENVAVLFISHRLDEVFEIADRITVLRDGEHISTRLVKEFSREQLIREMVGREVDQFYATRQKKKHGKRVLSVKNLSKEAAFSGIEFDLHQGEVLGFAGLVGSRRTDVGLALFGIQPNDSGVIELDGKK